MSLWSQKTVNGNDAAVRKAKMTSLAPDSQDFEIGPATNIGPSADLAEGTEEARLHNLALELWAAGSVFGRGHPSFEYPALGSIPPRLSNGALTPKLE
jgi:hypothetical protein